MIDFANLAIRIFTVGSDKATQDIEKVKRAGQEAEKAANVAATAVSGRWGVALGLVAAAGVTAAGVMLKLTRGAIEYGATLDKLGQQLGMSASELSKWKFVAEMNNATLGEFVQAVTMFSNNIDQARQRGSRSAEMFRALGIEIVDANGKLRSTSQLLLEVADRFKMYADSMAKTNMAREMFGRGGADLIAMLNNGKIGIEEFMRQAERLGIVMSNETAAQAAELDRALTRLKTMFNSLAVTVGSVTIPAIVKFFDLLSQKNALGDLDTQLQRAQQAVARFTKQLAEARNEEMRQAIQMDLDAAMDRLTRIRKQIEQEGIDRFARGSRIAQHGLLEAPSFATDAGARLLEQLREQAAIAGKTKYEVMLWRAEQEGVAAAAKQFIDQIRQADVAAMVRDLELQVVALTKGATEAERMRMAAQGIRSARIDALLAERDRIRAQREADQVIARGIEAAERRRELEIDFRDALAQAVRDAEQELMLLSMTNVEQQKLVAQKRIQLQLQQALRQTEDPEQQDRMRAAAENAAYRIGAAIEEADNKRRSFEYGWEQTMRSFVRDATDGARQAQEVFNTVYGTLEKGILDFAFTGKAAIKDLVATIARELLKIQLRRLLAQSGEGMFWDFLRLIVGGIAGANATATAGSTNTYDSPRGGTWGGPLTGSSYGGSATAASVTVVYENVTIGSNISRAEVAAALEENRKVTVATVEDMMARRMIAARGQ